MTLVGHAQKRDLDFFIQSGIANNPLLKDFGHQITSLGIDSQKIGAGYKPQITGISNNAVYPVINGWGYDQNLTNLASFNEMVGLSQNFVGHKNLENQYAGLRLLGDSIFYARKLAEQDLKRNIAAQFLVVYGDFLQIKFYRETYDLLQRQEMILKQLTEANIYRQTDYLTFLLTMKQQHLQLQQLLIQYRNDYYSLDYQCGIYDTAILEPQDPQLVLSQLPDVSVSSFFLRFAVNNALLENQAKLLDYNYHPKVNAFANAGYSSSLVYDAYKNFGAGAGINVSIPIYDGHQKALQKKKLLIQQTINDEYKDYFNKQYQQQVNMLMQQLAGAEGLVPEIEEQIKYANTLVEVNEKLMETGDAKIADIVIAINNYLIAKNLLTQNYISRMQIINQVNYWSR